jgi:hypothetical protein
MLQKAERYKRVLAASALAASEKCFFHWELEFPEVFYGPRPGMDRKIERLEGAGFDAVVGNPPYVNAIELNRVLSKFEKPYWALSMNSARGAYDLYILFLEKALRLLKLGTGRAGMITPNKYLAAPYGIALREVLLESAVILRILDVSRVTVFPDPSVYPVVLIYGHCKKTEPTTLSIDRPNNSGRLATVAQDYRMLRILPELIWGFLLSEGIDIVERLLSRAESMETLCNVNASTTASEADEFSKLLSEKKPKPRSGWKVVNTGTIDPYRLLWGDETFTHAGTKYLHPYLHDDTRVISENRRSQYNLPKLIFAKVARRIEAAFDPTGDYASLNTNFAFTDGEAGFFYLGLLNSKLLSWIYEQYFGALRMGGGYLQFQAPQLRCLPVVRFNIDDRQMKRVAELAQQYVQGQDEEVLELIDSLVCEIYGLEIGDVERIVNS